MTLPTTFAVGRRALRTLRHVAQLLASEAALAAPEGPRTVLLPSFNGARKQANLMPLVAQLLAREGVPVLIFVAPNGSLAWRFATGADVDAPITVLGDGTAVFGSDDGVVYALRDR